MGSSCSSLEPSAWSAGHLDWLRRFAFPPWSSALTVVAYGTSTPELAVSFQAGFSGSADLALGNVVGSNIFNVLLILGVSALIVPLVVSSQLIRWDVPLMIGASVLVLALGADGRIGRLDGILLFGGAVAYSWWCIRQSRKENTSVQPEFSREVPKQGGIGWDLLLILVGLLLLFGGSRSLVDGAVSIARHLGVSELIIGLTIVATGTSLPEVVTSIVAAVRGERDIAVGNVVGSNIFNILCVLGLTGAVAPEGVRVSSEALLFDIPVMIAVAVACLPIFFTGHVISRWEGGLFFGYYLAYTAYLVATATGSNLSAPLRDVMILFVIPLTAVTLAVTVWRSMRRRQAVAGPYEVPDKTFPR